MVRNHLKYFIGMSLLVLAVVVWDSEAHSGELQVSWTDNSTTEDGFKIERKTGTSGTYAQVGTVGANVTSYRDPGLLDGAVYCYRVFAFNSAAVSPYSAEACAPAPSTVQSFTVLVVKAGTGSGAVTSAPAGISCGGDCSESYTSGTIVTLTATPATGSTFAGWTGNADCADGSVTLDANKSCTATFNLQTFGLSVTKTGTGSGTVTSSPAGINCGSDCSESYTSGTIVTLSAIAAVGSTFAGWTGNADCTDGSVTINANKACTATFNLQTFGLSLTKVGTGSGTVTSSPAGINCGSDCSESYTSGTIVTLSAIAAAGSTFAGWTGNADCTDGSVTINANKACTATFNLQTFGLTVSKAGTGNGTVTSSPAGINCGSDCSESYTSGALVTLTAVAGTGSTFAGWSGNSDCEDGSVTINANKSCIATFNINNTPYALNVTVTKTLASTGTGNGTVTSSPAGINCGNDCFESYTSGTSVTLTAAPAAGSLFAGWSGDADCTDGSLTMSANKSCIATFDLQPAQSFTLSLVKAGTGTGTVTSSPIGINCGSTCSGTFNSGTAVILTAKAAAGSTFAGWSGTGCTTGSVTMNSDISCTATFQPVTGPFMTRIGIFRPDTGNWFLDSNGNGRWDGCEVDICISSFGQTGNLPVVGSWSGNGTSNIGIFDPTRGGWQLDTNGNGLWEGCSVDTCIRSFGQSGDFPVTREISGLDVSIIGTFTPRTTVKINGRTRNIKGLWNFDFNGNSTFDGCSVDECDTFGNADQLPIVGDWNGRGSQEIGLFLPRYGTWYLDLNGNGTWDGCRRDKCLGRFGLEGDLPVVGDWDGSGNIRIGVFRPSTGMWYLDLNGNGSLDSCSVDVCLGPLGQPGDLPVVGKW